jgi:large subunit ribosomal protein L10
MAITKQKKVEVLEKLSAGLKEAETVTFVNFHGLTVKETTELRKQLRESGVRYYVAKKTLVKRALDTAKVSGEQPALTGELALAWSDDAVASPKGVFEFQKTHKEKVTLLGGVYQGKYMSQVEITTLAAIPGMEGLRGQFLSPRSTHRLRLRIDDAYDACDGVLRYPRRSPPPQKRQHLKLLLK